MTELTIITTTSAKDTGRPNAQHAITCNNQPMYCDNQLAFGGNCPGVNSCEGMGMPMGNLGVCSGEIFGGDQFS